MSTAVRSLRLHLRGARAGVVAAHVGDRPPGWRRLVFTDPLGSGRRVTDRGVLQVLRPVESGNGSAEGPQRAIGTALGAIGAKPRFGVCCAGQDTELPQPHAFLAAAVGPRKFTE